MTPAIHGLGRSVSRMANRRRSSPRQGVIISEGMTVSLDGSEKSPEACKREEKGEKGKESGIPSKIHCKASQEVSERLITFIRTYILIVCFLWFLFEDIEKIIIEFRKGCECRRDSGAALFEDREPPPVHTLCPNGYSVGMKGDN